MNKQKLRIVASLQTKTDLANPSFHSLVTSDTFVWKHIGADPTEEFLVK